jgi:hypothetical protein
MVARSPLRRYGSSVLVALGWYLTVTAAVLTGLSQVPEPPSDCTQLFSCLTARQTFLLYAAGGTAAIVAALLVTLPVAWPLSRWLPSGILAGTLTAATTALLLGAGVLLVTR